MWFAEQDLIIIKRGEEKNLPKIKNPPKIKNLGTSQNTLFITILCTHGSSEVSFLNVSDLYSFLNIFTN